MLGWTVCKGNHNSKSNMQQYACIYIITIATIIDTYIARPYKDI